MLVETKKLAESLGFELCLFNRGRIAKGGWQNGSQVKVTMEPDSLGSGAETSGLEHFGDQIQALNARFPPVAQPGNRLAGDTENRCLGNNFSNYAKEYGVGDGGRKERN